MGGGLKPLLEVGGRTLFGGAVAAVTDAGCAPVVVAGPVLDAEAPVRWVREDPPFTGPAAAVAAALESAQDLGEWTLLIAGDLPYAHSVVGRLVAEIASVAAFATGRTEAFVFRQDDHPQWLAGAYRTGALRAAVAALGDGVEGASCRALLGGLEIAWLTDDDGITADIDTPADLERVRAELEEEA